MWFATDRRLEVMTSKVADLIHDREIEKRKDQAEADWFKTLETLWPLKSNEKPNSAS
jgi:hypothetical protein